MDGQTLFHFEPSFPGAEELAEEIRSRTKPPETDRRSADPGARQRMETIFPDSSSAQSETLECARCGTLIERRDMTRIGALRVDQTTCVCPACLRRGKRRL